MRMAVPITTNYLRSQSALLCLGPLWRASHRLPCAIAKPITVHILRGVYVKNSLGNACILQHVFRSRLQRQRLRLGQVEPSRLILFTVEDRDRDDAAGFRLPHLARPLQNSDRTHRRRSLLGVLEPSVLRPGRHGQRKQQDKRAALETPHRGIISLRALTLFCVAALHLVFWKDLSHGSERQSC